MLVSLAGRRGLAGARLVAAWPVKKISSKMRCQAAMVDRGQVQLLANFPACVNVRDMFVKVGLHLETSRARIQGDGS